jgi:hypothetical protein
MLKYPKLKAKDLANKIGVSVQDVYSTRYLAKKQNKANGYAPVEIKEGVEVGGLTLTKTPDDTYKWVRDDLLKPKEEVNHPPHYTVGGIEVIEFIEAMQLGYHLGNVVKYIARAGHKDTDPLQDLQKARWYLERAIQKAE